MDAGNSSRKRNETLMVGTASMQQHNDRFTRFDRVLIGTRNHHREKRTTVGPEIVNVVHCELLPTSLTANRRPTLQFRSAEAK